MLGTSKFSTRGLQLWDILINYYSDDRSPEVFTRVIESSTQMQAVLTPSTKPNCLIIDEIDGAPTVSSNYHMHN